MKTINKMKFAPRGIALWLVMIVVSIFSVFLVYLFYHSSHERKFVHHAVDSYLAQLAAETGIARASALIAQNGFEERWYKKACTDSMDKIKARKGYIGKFEGTLELGEGKFKRTAKFEVVAEDIPYTDTSANPPPKEIQNMSQLGAMLAANKYYRIDLFAKGIYRDSNIVVYSPLIIHPEEKIYNVVKDITVDATTGETKEIVNASKTLIPR